ncbi:phage tail protein [Brevibacillus agri]|uniref:phage tail protein n=1 Tax=Brevibacillus agri TaxID=51101 RepID=UPI0024BF973B|nr:phage tail protein [Brevibacillus agri]MED4570701.1 phage tail protein [Brevibacillus agri]WHX31543.1 phage tail protein [Brevibacillus agri]
MSQSVYTYADIFVSTYQFEKITQLSLIKQVNDHIKLTVSGIVPEEKLDQYVEQADENERIEVSVQDGARKRVLFQGIVTKLSVRAVRGVRYIDIEAYSATLQMDVAKKTRSFQNKQRTYRDLFAQITGEYPSAHVVDEASDGRKIGGLLVQYKETDWEFAKRLASHFHAPLVPVCTQKGLRYFVGVPNLGEPQKLEEHNYTIQKNLKEYKLKSENDMQDITEQNTISYEVASNKILDLGSPVAFLRRTLYVYRAETRIEHGILVHQYVLRDQKGLGCPTLFPPELAGSSLFGKVLDVAKDSVKVHLYVDKKQPVDEAIWFSYSTVYSSPDGSGWYCMPEVGDEVRLYFPDANEQHAFAASSVDLLSSDPQKRSDPSVKSISTKYGKQIIFRPGAIEIIGNGKLLMRLTDDGGIEINSDKKITLTAQEDIEIIGGEKVVIHGEAGVDMKQADATLSIVDDVTLSGAKVNIK